MRLVEESQTSRPQLAVAGSDVDGVHVIALAGELDIYSVDALEAAVGAASQDAPARVCLDLTGLRFTDSTGLAAIIRAHQTIVAGGGGLVIVTDADGTVQRTFATTGLLEMLSVVGDRASALADLA
jgi:anti-anti-sigma factor